MAREHARISTAIWIDDDFLDLTAPAQHLYFLIVSQMKLSFAGVTEWRPGRIVKLAANWSIPSVEAAALELTAAGYLVIDQESEEVLVRSFIRNDGLLSSPNITKAMLRDYSDVASRELRGVIVHELRRLHEENPRLKGWEVCGLLLEKRSFDPSEMPTYTPLSNPSVNPSRNPSVNPSDTGDGNPCGTPYSLLPTPLLPTPNSRPKTATYTTEFESAWSIYPLKQAKKKASEAFTKALKEVDLEVLLESIAKYRDDPNRDPKFTKHLATWLNQGCWEDEPLPARFNATNRATDRMRAGFEAMAGYNGPTEDPWKRQEIEA